MIDDYTDEAQPDPFTEIQYEFLDFAEFQRVSAQENTARVEDIAAFLASE